MRRVITFFFTLLTGCATQMVNSKVEIVPESTAIRWRVTLECMALQSLNGISNRKALSEQCRNEKAHDFVALALSGGATKAAFFSGEAMSYPQALGLLQQADVISSVSGGSFAGALYALS